MVKKGMVVGLLRLKVIHLLFLNAQGLTINAIASKLKTDYKNTYDAVEDLFEEKILFKNRLGNYVICKLNFTNDDVLEYIKEYNFYSSIREFKKNHPTAFNVLNETVNKMIEVSLNSGMSSFFICAVFGSYSKHDEKKESDIDILVLGQKDQTSQFEKLLKQRNSSYQIKFHLIKQESWNFMRDLNNKKQLSIASELQKQLPIILYGDDIFFKIMIEANKLW